MDQDSFRLLGILEVIVGGRLKPIDAPRQRAILSLLLLAGGKPVTVEQLVDAVWGDEPPATARNQVQICISALRRHLGGSAVIDTTPGAYALRVPDERVDLRQFERRLAAGRAAAASGRLEEASRHLRAALALWRGPALSGVPGRAAEVAAARLEELRMTATEELVEIDLTLGRHRELVNELMALVAEHPLRERLRGWLMLALYRSGRQAEALEVYQAARREYVEEWGLEPGEPLRRLEQAILTRDPRLDVPGPAGWLPWLATGTRTADIPQQLPADVADFTGRAELVEKLAGRIVDSVKNDSGTRSPVTVITGSGGIGKTTLALRVAHLVRHAFPDGQLYIELRSSAGHRLEPDEVLARFLQALGVSPEAIGSGLDGRAELYRSQLAGRRVLIVLDDAGDERQVEPLLPGMPGCAVIVTSRHRLGGLPGTLVTELPVLDERYSRELLTGIIGVRRAAADPAALATLARLCGGLPLALRIVGAKLATRPHWRLQDMVDRLVDERRRLDELTYRELDVRAALSVAYSGISPAARELFRLLGLVEAPHFGAWVPESLLSEPPEMVTALMDELIDARLVEIVPGDGGTVRHRMQELVRVFARERLRAEEPAATRAQALSRVLGGYLALAEEAHRRIYGGDYTLLHGSGERWPPAPDELDRLLRDPLAWLEMERPALVAAVRQAADAELDELCWDLAVTSVTLFEARGYYDDWRRTHEVALRATRQAGNLRGEAVTLCSLGSLATAMRGDDDSHQHRALLLFQRLGDDLGASLALRNLAALHRMRGRFDEAARSYEQALAGFRRVGDRVAEAHALGGLAQVRIDEGDLEAAEALLYEALRITHELGNARVEAQVSHRLGEVLLRRKRPAAAAELFRRVLAVVRRTGDRVGEIYALVGLGLAGIDQCDFAAAEAWLTEAKTLCRHVGGRQVQARMWFALGQLHSSRGDLAVAEEYLTRAAVMFAAQGATVWQERAQAAADAVSSLLTTAADGAQHLALGRSRRAVQRPPSAHPTT